MLYELLRGEQELLSTLDPQLYIKVTDALQAANIRYRVKAMGTSSGRKRRGTFGSFGENPLRQIQYQIFVKKRDHELARYQLRNVR